MTAVMLLWSVMLIVSTATLSFGADAAVGTLDEAARLISEALQKTDKALAEAARRVGKGLEADSNLRADIGGLCKDRRYAVDCAYVNARGIMEIVEPEKYRKYEGSNVAAQAATARMLKEKKPIFGELFIGVEERQAALFAYPAFNSKNEFVGAVHLLFNPEIFIEEALKGLKTGRGVMMLALQGDGTHVFASDPAQMRRNVLKSAEYQAFPELKGLVGRIVSQAEGVGPYRYVRPGTQQVVKKRALWKTVSLYDGFWRVVVTEPEKP